LSSPTSASERRSSSPLVPSAQAAEPTRGAPPGPAPRSRRHHDLGRLVWAAPALAFLAVFFVYPLWLLVDTSLREVSLGTVALPDNPFVGTENYRALGEDPDFRAAVPRTVLFLIGTVSVQLVVGVMLAQVLTQRMRGLSVPRFIVYFVWLLPPVVSGAIWKFALDGTEQGAVNAALLALGVIDDPILFLTTPTLTMGVIAMVNAWAGIPFVAIVMTAALKDVPEELYEAARVDGASPLRRFWHVTLPQVAPTLGILSALLIIYSFKAFDFIFVLSQGGPGTATATVPFLAYLVAFVQFDFGTGSAIGTLSVLFALLCATPYIVSTWRERRP
jgi:multiple sugar transport system permease protein